jgi:hypothetical protein
MAEKLGVASSTISEDVKAIREQSRQRAAADYASLLAEETAKLDLLERELLPEALHGGPEGGVTWGPSIAGSRFATVVPECSAATPQAGSR